METLQHYRGRTYLLHEYVVMPDHFHILITPGVTLERAVQFIKGGFSFRAKKELGSSMEIWQPGFSDHRIRGFDDYVNHLDYIYINPVRKELAECSSQYRYSSASPSSLKDEAPQWLKPFSNNNPNGAAEAAPLQNFEEELVANS
jgi:putative transposase